MKQTTLREIFSIIEEFVELHPEQDFPEILRMITRDIKDSELDAITFNQESMYPFTSAEWTTFCTAFQAI